MDYEEEDGVNGDVQTSMQDDVEDTVEDNNYV
jgi:hypothetical protein